MVVAACADAAGQSGTTTTTTSVTATLEDGSLDLAVNDLLSACQDQDRDRIRDRAETNSGTAFETGITRNCSSSVREPESGLAS